jgi:hypothetical protein
MVVSKTTGMNAPKHPFLRASLSCLVFCQKIIESNTATLSAISFKKHAKTTRCLLLALLALADALPKSQEAVLL